MWAGVTLPRTDHVVSVGGIRAPRRQMTMGGLRQQSSVVAYGEPPVIGERQNGRRMYCPRAGADRPICFRARSRPGPEAIHTPTAELSA
jgi:hypothetical protein